MTPASQPKPCVLVAIPEGSPSVPILRAGFATGGWTCLLAHRAEQVRDTAEQRPLGLVVLDMALRGAQQALHDLKLSPTTNWVPAIALFASGAALLRAAELRVRADVELLEPVALRRLVALADREAVRSVEPPSTRKVRFLLPSRHEELNHAAEIAAALLHASGLDEAAQASFLAAFREAVGNAIQHGNKGDPARAVHIEYRQNPATVTFSVRDEGPGFDAQAVLHGATTKDAAAAARDRRREGRHGGLGLLMLLRGSDRVRYNDKGNLVAFTKFIRRSGTGGPAAGPGAAAQSPAPPKTS